MDQPALLYTRYLPTATVTASDTFAGTAAADVLHATEDTFWRPADQSGDKTLTFDFGAARTLSRLGLLGNNLDGCVVELRASNDAFAAEDVLLAEAVILSALANAASVAFDPADWRYARLTFKDGFIPSHLRLAWACWGRPAIVPYLEEDFDPESLTAEGEHLVSRQGIYLGSERERTMRTFTLNFGQVTESEFTLLRSWIDDCIGRLNPFFFFPQHTAAACYFCWTAEPKFSAPLRNGLREVAAVRLLTRAI